MSRRQMLRAAFVISLTFVPAFLSWARLSARQAVEPRVIEIVATRFAFDPSTVEVTEGEPVRLLVRSGDGPHGFEIKQFKIKKELERGADPVVIAFTPDGPGSYPILCSTYCGEGHGDMKGTLVVVARPAAQ